MNGIGAVPARSSSWGFRVLTKLRERHPIWHAVAWVGVYVALVMVGGTLAGVPDAANPVTAAMVLGLSAALILYVAGIGRMHYYGLRPPGGRGDVARSLLFLPLAVIVLLQFTKGLRADLDVTSVLLVIGLMVGVGFVEELLFRGFLYRAILENGTLTRAVIISGLTFGIGHAVNLARGYTSLEQVVQVAIATALGVVLALLVAVTHSILPGVIFHVALNISGSVSAVTLAAEPWVVAATLVVSAAYAAYLVIVVRQTNNVVVRPVTTDAIAPPPETRLAR